MAKKGDYSSPDFSKEQERIYGPLPEGARLLAGSGRILDLMTAAELDLTSFTARIFRPGYDEKQVDETLDRATITLAVYEGFLRRTAMTLATRSLTKREMTQLIQADLGRINPSLVRVPEPEAEAAEAGTGVRDS